jgi:hypothetical protein
MTWTKNNGPSSSSNAACASIRYPIILAAMNLYSSLTYLVLATSRNAGQLAILRQHRVRLCGIVDMHFGESTFYALG